MEKNQQKKHIVGTHPKSNRNNLEIEKKWR